jgi:hypothetical protein
MDDPRFRQAEDEVLASYTAAIQTIRPDFDRRWVREHWLFRAPYAQPIVTTDYLSQLPPHTTPLPGVFLANMAHVYPQDRGQNYSLRLGERMARLDRDRLLAGANTPVAQPPAAPVPTRVGGLVAAGMQRHDPPWEGNPSVAVTRPSQRSAARGSSVAGVAGAGCCLPGGLRRACTAAGLTVRRVPNPRVRARMACNVARGYSLSAANRLPRRPRAHPYLQKHPSEEATVRDAVPRVLSRVWWSLSQHRHALHRSPQRGRPPRPA